MRVSDLRAWCGRVALLLLALGCADDSVPNTAADSGAAHDASAQASPCAAYQSEIDGFKSGLEERGESARIAARIVSAAPATPEKYLNDWTLDFLDMEGEALSDMVITKARSFMPVHGHDGTFPPTITALEEPGRFQVDDLNLWMRGPWLIQLDVSSPSAGTDYIEFSVCIPE